MPCFYIPSYHEHRPQPGPLSQWNYVCYKRMQPVFLRFLVEMWAYALDLSSAQYLSCPPLSRYIFLKKYPQLSMNSIVYVQPNEYF